MDEIEQYVRTYGVDDIEFLDDIFNQDRKRLTRFCELVAQRNLRIKIAFPNAMRADILTEGDVEALRGRGPIIRPSPWNPARRGSRSTRASG